jgi:hypothetical protein
MIGGMKNSVEWWELWKLVWNNDWNNYCLIIINMTNLLIFNIMFNINKFVFFNPR